MDRNEALAKASPVSPTASAPDPEHLADFVSTVPPVVTRLLVELGPFLSRVRWALQVVNWKSGSYSESWLALASFWGVCLWLHFTVRYFFPVLLLAPYIAASVVSYVHPTEAPKTVVAEAATETTVQTSLSDITIIHHLLPSRPPLVELQLPIPSAVRLVAAAYLVYVLTVFLLPANVIIALAGSFLLTWRAPWARTTRNILMSNGWIRYFSRRAWGIATGTTPPPEPSTSSDAKSVDSSSVRSLSPEKKLGLTSADTEIPADAAPPSKLRFRFIVHENQRWWVGLDWTAALLPQERASWTSAPPALKPVPPPMVITLPPTTTVWLPVFSSRGKDHLRMKRTATWSWADPAWAVVVRLSPASVPERVVMALPKVQPVDPAALESAGGAGPGSPTAVVSGPEGLLQRGLQRIGTTVEFGSSSSSTGTPKSPSRNASSSYGTRGVSPDATRRLQRRSEDANTADHDDEDGEHHDGVDVPLAKEEEETSVTDAEGWVYGDNKWEGSSGKGGIGKFTRSRRWTRVAILTETISIVPATDDPNYVPSASRSVSSTSPKRILKALPTAPILADSTPAPVVPAATTTGANSGNGTSALKRRLQQAVEAR